MSDEARKLYDQLQDVGGKEKPKKPPINVSEEIHELLHEAVKKYGFRSKSQAAEAFLKLGHADFKRTFAEMNQAEVRKVAPSQ